MVAIEIQGTGHYLDNEGKHPSGKHLLKTVRLKRENITVIEVNSYKIIDFTELTKIADDLINVLLVNNIEILPEYYYNRQKPLRDAGLLKS